MEAQRKYAFNWDLLGDIAAARPNLGPNARLEIYRLMQFCLRDVMEQSLGTDKTNQMFYEAGKLAGIHFYRNMIKPVDNLNDFVQQLQESLKKMGIGILRVEKADVVKGEFILTVSEDLDCSGMPELDYEICTYDEGFIAAIMESFTGKKFTVKEVDCWCTGERTCRFSATTLE